jgi:hypothetical protein
MIGAFAAFGVVFNLSVLAVLSYRGISFWLPTIPGVVAYLQLRRTVARWREESDGRSEPTGEYTLQSKASDGDELRWQTSRM